MGLGLLLPSLCSLVVVQYGTLAQLSRGAIAHMFKPSEDGDGLHDVYGFEERQLPPLPNGKSLKLLQRDLPEPSMWQVARENSSERCTEAEDAAMWAKLSRYVSTYESGDIGPLGIGGEVWPAAAALCSWLNDNAESVCGATVLELGCGTGACGLHAAALGAAHVTLTDGGSEDLLSLARANVAANREHFGARTKVEVQRLTWQCGRLEGTLLAPDLVLASDLIYCRDPDNPEASAADHDALAATLVELLAARGAQQGGTRVLFAHEHRAREGLLGVPLRSWDEADPPLLEFVSLAERHGLRLHWLTSERPHAVRRGHSFRSWTADLSLFEVRLSGARDL